MHDYVIQGVRFFDKLKDLPPLFFRLALAIGFYPAAINKYRDLAGCANYFAALGIPCATWMAYFVMIIETLGCILLFLGAGTRPISTLLFFVMMVALFVAHLPHGIDYTTPVWFSLALFSLMTTGAGRFSVDHFTCKGEKSLRKVF